MDDKGEILVWTYLAVLFCIYVGAVAHYTMVRATKRSSVSLLTYMVFGNRTGVLLKAGALASSAWQFCKTAPGANSLNLELLWARIAHGFLPVTGIDVIVAAVLVGYAADSLSNNVQTLVTKK